MATEYWGTLSIYDHRSPIYRHALVMFDRVVVPVPESPVGRLTADELDALSADVNFLVGEGRAIRFDWNPSRFQEWRQEQADKAAAGHLGKDPQADTRYQLQQEVEEGTVHLTNPFDGDRLVLPVAGSMDEFESHSDERSALHVVLGALPVPNPYSSLEDICRLRDHEGFATSLRKMRVWQDDLVLALIDAETDRKKEVVLRQARARLDDWLATYRRLVEDAGLDGDLAKVTAVSSMGEGLALGPFGFGKVLKGVMGLLGMAVARRPSWKAVADEECSPAGVIYHSAGVL